MLAKGSPEVGVVRYELACLFVNSGGEEVQLEYGYVWVFLPRSLHHQHKQHHSTMRNTSNRFWYHGFCFCFRHAEINAEIRQFASSKYSRLCWKIFGPRDIDGERER